MVVDVSEVIFSLSHCFSSTLTHVPKVFLDMSTSDLAQVLNT